MTRRRGRVRMRRRSVWLTLGSPFVFIFFGTAACNGQEGAESVGDAGGDPIDAVVAELLPRLEALSGLEAVAPIRVERRDREELRTYLAEQLDQELPPEELEGIAATYGLLGLLPDTVALRSLMLELYTEQVLGYYAPETETLYLVEGAEPEALRPILAHEMVHALQDQHAPLDSLVDRGRGNDRQLAAQAALEGHATLVMLRYMLEERLGREISPAALPDLGAQLDVAAAMQGGDFPVFDAAPAIIRETLIYPYTGGARFVQALWRRHPGAAPLDSLLPVSTEQVSAPVERFIQQRDAPTDVRFGELSDAAGEALYTNTLGQLETSIFLREHGGDAAAAAAEGWDGDRVLLVGPADSPALLWASVWDSDAAAARFAGAVERVLADRDSGSVATERTQVDGRPVVIVWISQAPRARPQLPDIRLDEGRVAGPSQQN